MTQFERIKNMTVEEMAEFFAVDKYPNFPSSPCYVCEYDEGIFCNKPTNCTDENKARVYQKWLESECIGNIKKYCKTCRYWSKIMGGICMHKNHSGDFVPEYAVCDDYES